MKRDDAAAHLLAPPHNIEAEQSVIGALLIDNRAFDVIADTLQAEHFYRVDHRELYTHASRMIMTGIGVDTMTLFESVQSSGKADLVNGLSYINSLATRTPGAANVKRYAEIVIDRAKKRGVLSLAMEIEGLVHESAGASADTIIDRAQEKFERLARAQVVEAGPVLVGDDLGELIQDIDDQYHDVAPAAKSTGFIDLDARLNGGLRGGELIVIAGRPSMGKTALAMCIADAISLREPVAVFSLEMPRKQLNQRNIARIGSIPLPRVIDGKKMRDEDWPRFTYAVERLRERQMYVDDQPALSLVEIRNRSRAVKRRAGGLGLIVVDYLGLMTGGERNENRNLQIGSYSRGLKALAKQLGVPIIALAQLSRDVEKRPNKRPLMSDLRDSGEIEQDADVILMLYRDEVYNEESMDKGIAEVIIGKQRNGATGRVGMVFAGEFARFSDLAAGATFGRAVAASRPKRGFDDGD